MKKYTSLPPEIFERIKQARIRRGLRQDDLADLSGITQGTISQIEAGKLSDIGASVLFAIAKALEEPSLCVPDWAATGGRDYETDRRRKCSDDFIDSPIAAALDLSQQERSELNGWVWYKDTERPTAAAWHDFIRARRGVVKRKSTR